MNRRRFLRALAIGGGAIIAAARLPTSLFAAPDITRLFNGPVTFKGIPIVYDRDCPANMVYFINLTNVTPRRCGVITDITA